MISLATDVYSHIPLFLLRKAFHSLAGAFEKQRINETMPLKTDKYIKFQDLVG